MRYVSDARFAELPPPLQEATTWTAREEMRPPANADRAVAAYWSDYSRIQFLDQVEEFVARDLLPPEPLLHLHVGRTVETPIELIREEKSFALRARRFAVVAQWKEPRSFGTDRVEAAAELARKLLAVPLVDPATGTPLRREGAKAFADGAWIEFRCPKAGGFLGGMCPRLWVYADARTAIGAFPVLVDRRPRPGT